MLSNERMRKNMGKDARKKVIKELSWNVTVRKTLDFYKEIL
jgi:glycosyltransferase involved in cell wall biosynthesis